MKACKNLLRGLLTVSAFTLLSVGTASAAGTAAGTNVQNTFTLDYAVGGVDQPTIDTDAAGTPTEFTVDRVVNLTVASGGNNTVAPGATAEELTYTLTNTGNDTQSYLFTLFNEAENGAAADEQFDASNLTITYYVGNSATGTAFTYDPADAFSSLNVPADGQLYVVVSGDIPTVATVATLDDGDTAAITLVADTREPHAVPADGNTVATAEVVADPDATNTIDGAAENVLADGAADEAPGTSPYDRENSNQGDFSATGVYIVASADLLAEKTVYVLSEDGSGCAAAPTLPSQELASGLHDVPTNGFHAIPGACVEYRISAVNNGADANSNVVNIDIVDDLPTDLTFVRADQNGFTNVNFTVPAVNTDCGVGPCTVRAVSTDPVPSSTLSNLDFDTNGVIVIRALVK